MSFFFSWGQNTEGNSSRQTAAAAAAVCVCVLFVSVFCEKEKPVQSAP